MKKHYQKQKNLNPAVQRALTEQKITNALKDARQKGIDWACLAYEIMALMVLHDKFGIDDSEELKRYCIEMNNLSDTMLGEYANLSDFVLTLHDECGFTMSEEDLIRIDPSLAGLMDPKEEEK